MFTGSSSIIKTSCQDNLCVTLDEAVVSAEAGLCAVIPCSFSGSPYARLAQLYWFKCKSTEECENPVMIFQRRENINARVSLLEDGYYLEECSIIISDLTESDSGSYYPHIELSRLKFSPNQRTTVSVKGTKDYIKFKQQGMWLKKYIWAAQMHFNISY